MSTNSAITQAQKNANDGFVLLKKRKEMYESAKAQTDAVKDAFKQMQSSAASQGKKVENISDDLAQKIMILSNFTIREQPDEAKYQMDVINKTSGEKEGTTLNEKAFKEAEAEFKQYQALDKQIKEETKKLGIEEKDLEALKKAANDKETELINKKGLADDAKENLDFSLKEYEKLQKDLEKAEFEVRLGKKEDNLTLVAGNSLNESSINGASADSMTVYKGIVAGDKANGANSSKQHYTHMQIGDSHKYNFDQVKAMGGEAMDFDLSDDFVISSAGLNALTEKLNQEDAKPDENQGAKPDTTPGAIPTQPKNPNEHYHSGGVTKARGIPYNDKKEDEDYGFKHDDKTGENYSLSDLQKRNAAGTGARIPDLQVRTLTDAELNEAMRKAEDTVHPGYSKLLDKAEALGVDIDSVVKSGMSGDDAYKAVKSAVKDAEKSIKAVAKAVKAEVKAAKKEAKAAEKSKPQTKANSEPDKVATQSKPEAEKTEKKGKPTTEEQLLKLSENERKTYEEILSKSNENRAGFYLRGVSRMREGQKGTLSLNGVSTNYTIRLTNDGDKVYQIGNEFFSLDNLGSIDLKKPVKKEDIKPMNT